MAVINYKAVRRSLKSLRSQVGSALVGFIQAGTGAVKRWVQDKLRETVSVKDFGAVGDGTTDDTTSLQAAFTAMSAGSRLVFPPGTYLVSANLTRSGVDRLCLSGRGAKIYENGASLTGVFTFTNCDDLTIEGFDFEATEDNTYFQANSPTAERSFIDLDTCDRASVRSIRGKNKRRLLTAEACHYLHVADYHMQGFLQNVSVGAVVNGNSTPAVTIRGCDYSVITNGTANNCGSVLLGQLSSEHVTVSQITGHDLHDNGVYCSSGFHWTVSDVTINWCVGNAVQTRGANMTVTNVTGKNFPSDYVVDMTGLGLTEDATWGADTDGFGLTCSNVVADACYGAVNIGANTYYPRDINISNVVATGCTATGVNPPVQVVARRGVVVSNIVLRTFAADIGVLIQGPSSGTKLTGVMVSNVLAVDGNGSSATTRGGLRLDYLDDFLAQGCVFQDIASGVGVRILTCTNGLVEGNVYIGGQVVRQPTAESTSGVTVIGNKGSTMIVDGDNNTILDNDAVVTGYPAISTTPRVIGQRTYSGNDAFVATGVSSSSDWRQLTEATTATAANIAAVANTVNTTGKFAGKQVWDSTNNRMMRANGSAAADPWYVIDGSASVTPA